MNVAWKKLNQTRQKVGYKNILQKQFLLPNGQDHVFTVIDDPDSVCAFVLTDDQRVVVARQFRPGLEVVMDELPGGHIDKDETPLAAIRRELLEETGYTGNFEPLGVLARDAYIDARWHYFLVTNCRQVQNPPKQDKTEYIEVTTISIAELLHNITHAKMSDPALALLALRKLNL